MPTSTNKKSAISWFTLQAFRGLLFALVGFAAVATLLTKSVAAQTTEELIKTDKGAIQLTPITHASVQLEFAGKVIHIDPWSKGNYANAKPADLILITDIHGDHFDSAAIAKIRKLGAPVVAPAAVAEKFSEATVIKNGESKIVAGISIEAVPMYNLERGPQPGQLYHTKGRGNGYVLNLGGKRIYFSGDTEGVPEIRGLKNIDVAFITMNLPYTMPPAEAADTVKAFKPKIVYPYHYRGSKLEEFTEPLKGQPIEVRVREWYPAAAAGSTR